MTSEDFLDYDAYMKEYLSKDIVKLMKVMQSKLPQTSNKELNSIYLDESGNYSSKLKMGNSLAKMMARYRVHRDHECDHEHEESSKIKKQELDEITVEEMKSLKIPIL